MRTPLRRLGALLLVLLVLGTAGCGRLTGKVGVNSDDTVDVRLELSVPDSDAENKRLLEEGCTSATAPRPEVFHADGRTGCRITGHLNAAKQANLGIAVATNGDRQQFRFAVASTGSDKRGEVERTRQRLASISELDLRVTFRGPVVRHSGSSTLEGRTVVWRNSADLAEGLEAEAERPGLLDRTPGEWVAIALVGLALVGSIAWIVRDVLRRRPVQHHAPWGGPSHEVPRD